MSFANADGKGQGTYISKLLARLERLTTSVREYTERNLHRFRRDPEYGHSEPMWRMAMLVTFVKRDFGATYNPTARDEQLAGAESTLTDSRDVFLHGLLDDDPRRRWGTCASIPVLITAVARRLRYPVALAVAGRHLYARWEGCECFNIEASNPMGMTVLSDEHYRTHHARLTREQERSGFYLRSLTPAEEFALFLSNRVWALRDAARYAETFLWSARALQFSPDEPVFPHAAHQIVEIALSGRWRAKYSERRTPAHPAYRRLTCDLGELLAPHERSLVLTIIGHYLESLGAWRDARVAYEGACRQNPAGNNERRDLQRFARRCERSQDGHRSR